MSEKILIVDDEAEITDLIEMYLHNENYRKLQVQVGHPHGKN